jgi:hypothetical protein
MESPSWPQGATAPAVPAAAPAAPAAKQGDMDWMAIWSLGTGFVGIFCCLGILGFVAFYLGQSSLRGIEESNGALRGAGIAKAGRILGAIGVVELVIALGFLVYQLINNR